MGRGIQMKGKTYHLHHLDFREVRETENMGSDGVLGISIVCHVLMTRILRARDL